MTGFSPASNPSLCIRSTQRAGVKLGSSCLHTGCQSPRNGTVWLTASPAPLRLNWYLPAIAGCANVLHHGECRRPLRCEPISITCNVIGASHATRSPNTYQPCSSRARRSWSSASTVIQRCSVPASSTRASGRQHKSGVSSTVCAGRVASSASLPSASITHSSIPHHSRADRNGSIDGGQSKPGDAASSMNRVASDSPNLPDSAPASSSTSARRSSASNRRLGAGRVTCQSASSTARRGHDCQTVSACASIRKG